MKCPKCNAEIPDKAIAAHLAAKGGAKSSVGKSAAERTAKAKAAAKARWSKQPARRMVEAREKKKGER